MGRNRAAVGICACATVLCLVVVTVIQTSPPVYLRYGPLSAETKSVPNLVPPRAPTRPSWVPNGPFDIDVFQPPIEELNQRFHVVTAISQNHFEEVMPWLAGIQEFMPNTTIILFDLGINPGGVKKLKVLCNVEVRRFPFENYPPHVKKLGTYAFKPIIMEMTLSEFGVMFWGDASVRLKTSLFPLVPLALKHHGFMTLLSGFNVNVLKLGTGFHQHKFTHPKIYEALGVNMTEYVNSGDRAPFSHATHQFYINGSYIREKLLHPLLKCALDVDCIAPPGSNIGNHRYDSSALNILMYKNLQGEWSPQNNDNKEWLKTQYVARGDRKSKMPKSCPA